jgi:hypothetical protein
VNLVKKKRKKGPNQVFQIVFIFDPKRRAHPPALPQGANDLGQAA